MRRNSREKQVSGAGLHARLPAAAGGRGGPPHRTERAILIASAVFAFATAMVVQADEAVDFSKPLFIAAGQPMCASSSDVRASLGGAPSDCSQASRPVPVITLSNAGVDGIFQVRLLGVPSGTIMWVPYTSLTNAGPPQ